MQTNLYSTGQSVRYTPNRLGRGGGKAAFTVVAVLPLEQGEQQYRIKNAYENHERVVPESQLESLEHSVLSLAEKAFRR